MNKYVAFLKELWNKKYLEYRLKLVKELVGKDPVIMNVHITSDIVSFNKLDRNERVIFWGNTVKTVSSRQSFVFSPNNTKVVY